MSHGINAYYRNAIGTPAQAKTVAQPRPAAATATAGELAAARTAQPAATTRSSELSDAETQVINRYFPASESMSLRLYGPGTGVRTLSQATVGSRLDIQG